MKLKKIFSISILLIFIFSCSLTENLISFKKIEAHEIIFSIEKDDSFLDDFVFEKTPFLGEKNKLVCKMKQEHLYTTLHMTVDTPPPELQ